jgi:secreted trypsin-like serine protease
VRITSKISKFGVSLVLTLQFFSPTANAVENGETASGSEFVVPINIQSTAASFNACSGAVVTPLVVATAGHCVLSKSGLISEQIIVGEPGSQNIPTTSWIKVLRVFIDDDYKGNTAEGLISNSDIAFLLLEKPIKSTQKIFLASENELISLKSSNAKLRIIGYGYTSDSGSRATTPNFMDSVFQKTVVPDPNQAVASSTKANICQGDSGAPVLNITPTKVTLVGVVTGAYPSNYCSKKQIDGNYLAAFSVINRFSNLAAEAIAESLKVSQNQNNQPKSSDNNLDVLTSQVSALEAENAQLMSDIEALRQELEKQKLIIGAFKKTGQKAISCSNLVSTKIVVGKNPVCPKGFKKE